MLEQLLNEPCPRHDSKEKPATHLWKDCTIMKAFKNSNMFDGNNGPSGSGGGDFHGHGDGSNPNFQNSHGNQGGYNQQAGQGSQQQQQGGYQSHPKQLNSGQYHVFTTSLCKRDQKLHKRAVNAVEPAVPRYL